MNLNLKSYTSHPAISSSLAWSALRDILTRLGRGELIASIESVKISDTRITIKTGKPIINMELSNYKEDIQTRIDESFKSFGIIKKERKIVFI